VASSVTEWLVHRKAAAEWESRGKCTDLPPAYIFQPIAIDSLSSFSTWAPCFLSTRDATSSQLPAAITRAVFSFATAVALL